MAKITEDQVLLAVDELPLAWGVSMFQRLCDKLGPSRWLKIAPDWRLSVGQLYVRLTALEQHGLLTSDWSKETFPERGGRRRRYYYLTDTGRERVAELRAMQQAALDEPHGMAFAIA